MIGSLMASSSGKVIFDRVTLSVNITNRNPTLSVFTNNRRFRATFGISPTVCSEAWRLIAARGRNTQEKIEPLHLLWTLCFFKLHDSEHVVSAIVVAMRRL
jgi:hypothetical protein